MVKNLHANLQDLDQACKEYFLKSDADLTILVLVGTALLVPPINYLDYLDYHWGENYLIVSSYEAFLVVFSILVIQLLRQGLQVKTYENLVFAWTFFIALAVCFIVFFQPDRVVENVLFNELFLFAIYVLLNNRIIFRVIPAFLLFVTSLVAICTSHVSSFQYKLIFLFSLLVINALGPFVIFRTNQFKRTLYIAQKCEREARLEFERLATVDPLTGVLNRRSFFEQAQLEFARFKRLHSSFCFAIIDLDYFKKVNDQFSHLAGDEVLKNISDTISSVKRPYDIFGRLGGDEFGLVFPQTNLGDAEKIILRIQEAVRKTLIISQANEFNVTFSGGIISAGENDTSLDDLIRRADEALYRSKAHGRDRIDVVGRDQ